MDDTAYGTNLEVPYMDEEPSAETCISSGQLAAEQTEAVESQVLVQACLIQNCDNNDSVPRGTENLIDEIEEFIPGVRRYYKNICGNELQEHQKNEFRQLLPLWNTFLQSNQCMCVGIWCSSAISSRINGDIKKFIPWLTERQGTQSTQGFTNIVINHWLSEWNVFVEARAGKTLVTSFNLCLTIVGFIFYMLDLVSDMGTSVYYASNGQWWRFIVTLALVYCAIMFHMIIKWIINEIHCSGLADWLRYAGSVLVNWPDVKQYGGLCLLEWKLHKSPTQNAHLIPEWHRRSLNVANLKFIEGVCEACPQAILQLCLLVPDLYGDWTWTDYLRITATSVSLCTAGVALVNREKYERIKKVPTSELFVLHVWVVPVTVSRLLSLALLLSVHPYWALTGVALHLVLFGVHWYISGTVPHTLSGITLMCLGILQFLISPFMIARTVTYRRMLHAIHFLCNSAATVVWAFGTPLMSVHPALCIAILCFNTAMFAVGLLGWQLHEKYYPYSYFTDHTTR